jgi:hypothetical protein
VNYRFLFLALFSVLPLASLTQAQQIPQQIPQQIQSSPLQISDLAQLMGQFEALELSIPPKTRSYLLASPGARLSGSLEPGNRRALGGVSKLSLQTCQGENKLAVYVGLSSSSSSWSCADAPANSLTPAFRAIRLSNTKKGAVSMVLNQWTPLWAYIPNLRMLNNGTEVSNPSSWMLWQIYLSDKDLINLKDIPEPPQYEVGQITLF